MLVPFFTVWRCTLQLSHMARLWAALRVAGWSTWTASVQVGGFVADIFDAVSAAKSGDPTWARLDVD